MNSPFANIYLSLIRAISGITSGATAQAITYIDMDYGQLETHERPAVAFPCVLIDFNSWRFTDLGLQAQKAEGMIIVKLAADPYTDTSSITPESYKEAGINILDLEYQLYKVLQGLKPAVATDGSGNPTAAAAPMSRVSITSDDRRPGLKVRVLTFATAFTDYSATPTVILASPAPVITPQTF